MNGKVLLLIAVLCLPLAATAQQKDKRVAPPSPMACRQLADTFAKVGARMAIGDMLQLRNCLSRILIEKGRKEMGSRRGTRRGAPHPRMTPLRPPGQPVPGHPGARMPQRQQRTMPGTLKRPGQERHPGMPPATRPAKPEAPPPGPAPESPSK